MIKACLFDLDGTLLNTIPSIARPLNCGLSRHGVEGIEDDRVKEFVGEGARSLLRRALKYRGFDPEGADAVLEAEIFADFIKEYNSDPTYMAYPYEGIPELLTDLKSRGVKLAVVTNKPHPAAILTVERFFGGIFDYVIGGVDGVALKPNPNMPITACDALGVAPSEVVYTGDSGTDMRTGKGFGARLTLGVNWGYRDESELIACGADAVIGDPHRILELIEDL